MKHFFVIAAVAGLMLTPLGCQRSTRTPGQEQPGQTAPQRQEQQPQTPGGTQGTPEGGNQEGAQPQQQQGNP